MSARHDSGTWLGAQEVGSRVRRLRLMAGMTQQQLALRLQANNSYISRVENGRIAMDDDLLRRISHVVDCSPRFVTAARHAVLSNRPLLRAYADAPQHIVDQQMAHCVSVAEVIDILKLPLIRDTLPTYDIDPTDDQQVEEFAAEVRSAAELGEGDVVGNCIRAAERIGVVVLPMKNELGRHLGMSMRVDLLPFMCIGRSSSVPGDRQRFTVAHELGHLALHGHRPPPQTSEEARELERQANRFAGAFLAPGDALAGDLEEHGGKVTLSTLARLKERWGISIRSLVMRVRQLGIIDEIQSRSLFKQISSRGWNTSEPVPVGNEDAIWLSKALHSRACERGKLDDVAEQIGIGRSYLEQWIDWSGTSDSDRRGQVMDLPVRRAEATLRPERATGEVVPLKIR